jgi:hypothetical protein
MHNSKPIFSVHLWVQMNTAARSLHMLPYLMQAGSVHFADKIAKIEPSRKSS